MEKSISHLHLPVSTSLLPGFPTIPPSPPVLPPAFHFRPPFPKWVVLIAFTWPYATGIVNFALENCDLKHHHCLYNRLNITGIVSFFHDEIGEKGNLQIIVRRGVTDSRRGRDMTSCKVAGEGEREKMMGGGGSWVDWGLKWWIGKFIFFNLFN